MKARAILVPLPEGMTPDDDADTREGVVVVPAPNLPEHVTEGDVITVRQRAWSVAPSSECGECHGRGIVRVYYHEPGEKEATMADEPCGCVRLAIVRAEREAVRGSGVAAASVASRQTEQNAAQRAEARRKRITDEIGRAEELVGDLERQRERAVAPYLAAVTSMERIIDEQDLRHKECQGRVVEADDMVAKGVAIVADGEATLAEARHALAQARETLVEAAATEKLSGENLEKLRAQLRKLNDEVTRAASAGGVRHKLNVSRKRLADLRDRLASLAEPEPTQEAQP